METSTLLDYDLGGEGDLFKAPEPIIEEPVLALDPMTAAMSMITGGGDITTAESIEAVDLESVQNDPLLGEVFYEALDLKSVQNDPLLSEVLYECTNDLLIKFAIEESLPELLDVQIPAVHTEDNPDMLKNSLVAEGPMQKAVSSGSLTSSVWISGDMVKPNYIDFRVDLGDAFGMRRAYSEGDIQTLGNNNLTFDNMRTIQSSSEQLLTISDFKIDNKIEERRQKLSRYRKKKSKRNFGRKIKYACRKTLADSQPRVRGRFAKTEDYEAIKLQR